MDLTDNELFLTRIMNGSIGHDEIIKYITTLQNKIRVLEEKLKEKENGVN